MSDASAGLLLLLERVHFVVAREIDPVRIDRRREVEALLHVAAQRPTVEGPDQVALQVVDGKLAAACAGVDAIGIDADARRRALIWRNAEMEVRTGDCRGSIRLEQIAANRATDEDDRDQAADNSPSLDARVPGCDGATTNPRRIH